MKPDTDDVPMVAAVHPVTLVYLLQPHWYDIVNVDETLKTVRFEVVVWVFGLNALDTAYCKPKVLRKLLLIQTVVDDACQTISAVKTR